MGWIGLHPKKAKHPHLTLAWWPNGDRKATEDATLWLPEITPQLARPIVVKVIKRDMFGRDNDIPVHIVTETPLDYVRRWTKKYDKRKNKFVGHVTIRYNWQYMMSEYTFIYVGVHTGDKSIYSSITNASAATDSGGHPEEGERVLDGA